MIDGCLVTFQQENLLIDVKRLGIINSLIRIILNLEEKKEKDIK